MKKKLEAELMSIAHRVLKLSGRNDLAKLHLEAQKLTEALAILRFYETNYTVASQEVSQEAFDEKLSAFLTAETQVQEVVHHQETDAIVEVPEIAAESPKEEIAATMVPENNEEKPAPAIAAEIPPVVKNIPKQISLEDFLMADYKDPEFVKVEKIDVSIKEAAEVVFEKAIENEPVETVEPAAEANVEDALDEVEKKLEEEVEEVAPTQETTISEVEETSEVEEIVSTKEETKIVAEVEPIAEVSNSMATSHGNVVLKSEYVQQTTLKTETKTMSLNDRLTRGINIGLNDRIAFVKHLFGSNNEDYNRVISQLNTFNSHEEAISFIENMVKPDYQNWDGKEDYAERFLTIVEKKFL